MGLVNLGGGSFQDYQAWTQTAAGKQSAANHQAKYGDQSKSMTPTVWQPDKNWQQQLSAYRNQQSGPPVIGNAPNGRPVTGAYGQQPVAPKGGFEVYRPSQAQPKTQAAGPDPSGLHQYWNAQGKPFTGSVSWAPGTTEEQQTRGYEELANKKGYFARPTSPAAPPAPPQQPSQGTPYADPSTGMYYRQPISAPPPTSRPATPPAPRVQDMFQAAAPMFTPFSFTMPMGPQSPADLPPDQRPPGFTQTFTDPFGNQTQNNPMAQRDALIQLLNQQSLPYYMGRGGRFTPNLQDLWGQAGSMIANGWSNPLAGLFG